MDQQPVPAEKLRELYTEKLEIQISNNELEVHARNVQAALAAYQSRVDGLQKEYAIDFGDFAVDLKAGTMTLLPKIDGGPGKETRAIRRRGLRKAKS